MLDNLKTFRVGYWAPVLLGLIMLFDSWDSIAIAYAMPSMLAEWRLSPLQIGIVISSGYAGQFAGAIVLGALAERFGRMPIFIVAATVMAVLALACAYAPNYEMMVGIRFVQGVMIGGALPISVTYINELAPTQTRGRYFTMFQVLAMAGYAAASVSSTFIIPHWGWRWLFALGAAPIVLVPLAALTLPESPRWLARIGRFGDANRALAQLGGGPAIEPPEIQSAASVKGEPKLNTLVLFGRGLWARTAIVTLLWFLTSFANFGLTTWVPSIYVTVFHIPVANALKYGAASSVGFLIISPFLGLIMDRTGRRPIAMIGTAIATIMMIALAFHRPSAEMVLVPMVLLGHVAISATSLILWPYTAETYPTNVRALGLGYASSIARGASMLTPLCVGVILSTGASIAIVFATFGVCAFGAFLMWVTLTRETARKPLESI